MSLIKKIVLENGVIVNYHRVVSVNNVTNKSSIIEIASYTSKEKREEEKTKLSNKESMNIFIKTEFLDIPYIENLNVVSAYEYLRTIEKFSGCTDDMDKI